MTDENKYCSGIHIGYHNGHINTLCNVLDGLPNGNFIAFDKKHIGKVYMNKMYKNSNINGGLEVYDLGEKIPIEFIKDGLENYVIPVKRFINMDLSPNEKCLCQQLGIVI